MELVRGGFFLFIPMRGEGRYRLFGALPPDLATRNSLTLDEVRSVLDAQSKEHITLRSMRWNSVYRTHHRIAERFRVGRVFLVGDAAHIHSPAGGQGMNTGIGDAFNLGWKLALVVKGGAHETLLDSYEAERIPFARSILRGSDLGFHIQASTNPVLQWLKVYAIPPAFSSPVAPAAVPAALFLASFPTLDQLSYQPGGHGVRTGDAGTQSRRPCSPWLF